MRKFHLAIASILIGSIGTFAQTINPNYVDGEIWVKIKNTTQIYETNALDGDKAASNKTAFDYFLRSFNITSIHRPYKHVNDNRLNRVYRIKIADANRINELIETLNSAAIIEYAEKIPLTKKTLTPNDPNFNGSTQWCLYQINATQAWNVGTGSSNIVVAIVDDAVETTHSDLSPSIYTNPGEIANNGVDDDGNGYIDDVNGFDVANNDNNPDPDNPINSYDHGTHVAGIAGAASNNNIGVASIGYGVSILPVKATNSASVVSHGYDGIVYAVSAGADVINMSWGGSGFSNTGQNIINWAAGQGIVLVAAAGNDNVSSQFYPAAYNNVISVASTTTGDAKSSFSNYGNWIDISAPGSAIYSTIPGNGYAYKQGTSMASPMVAGLAGLMLSLNPSLTPADIENCILTTADDVDTPNPSYTGQLGAGRINALEAMNCISATLNWPPEADFTANITNIVQGQQVSFNDLSIHNPTSWSWTFTGGTPASSSAQNPPAITYNTPGTYAVTLTATNANGNDTETKTAYITVNGLSGCDTISNTLATDAIYTYSYSGGGYIGGHNPYGITQWAEKFSGYGPTSVTGSSFYFTEGMAANANSEITIMVWEDNGGNPSATPVYTETLDLNEIALNAAGPGNGNFYITNITFDNAATVTTNDFFIGYELTSANAGDTVACAVVQNFGTADLNNTTRPNTAYFNDANGWTDYETATTGASKFSFHIYPRITANPTSAVINATPNTACVGDIISFDASSSPNGVNFDWAINGTSTPYPSGTVADVVMNAAGTHTVYLQAFNSCGFWHIDSSTVTVNATPNVSVTTSNQTICPGNSANLSASGATSYVWTPGATLNNTGIANPVATPASTTTYSVTGTTGSCSSTSDITITVDNAVPTAQFIASTDTACEGDIVTYNGAISSGASAYNWAFTGGDISSSNSSNPSVTYATAGTYNIDLTATNTCSQSDNTSGTIVILPAGSCGLGIKELAENFIQVFYNNSNQQINLEFLTNLENASIEVFNSVGQKVVSEEAQNFTTNQLKLIDIQNLSNGMYILNIRVSKEQFSFKFVK